MLVAALMLAGCGTSPWTDITLKRINSDVASTIHSITYDSVHDVLYAATNGMGVLRCTSPGSNPTWTNMVGGANLDYVRSVLYEPTGDVLYAGANSNVYSWANPVSASSWKTTNGVGENFSLAYDPDQDVLYAGTRGGVYACTNPASSPVWANTGGGVDGSTVGSLLYDPARRVLFAATDTQGIGVWKYHEGTWVNTDKNFSKSRSIGRVSSLAYDSARDILYATCSVYTSSEGEILVCKKAVTDPSWTRMGGSIISYGVNSLAYDQAHDILYAGTCTHGEPFLHGPVLTYPSSAVRTQHVIKCGKGVLACASPDSNPAWTNTGGGVKSQDVCELLFDPAHGVLYALTSKIDETVQTCVQVCVWRYEPQTKGKYEVPGAPGTLWGSLVRIGFFGGPAGITI